MFVKHLRFLNKKTVEFLIPIRSIQTNVNAESIDQFTSVEIDVPWGTVSGKLWGSPVKQPVLALHGWMDNAGSFDNLAPLLMKNSSILAVDLPGHGLSSWLPRGIPYSIDTMTIALRAIVKYFGWNQVKFLSHSASTIISSNYAKYFPGQIKFVVYLDCISFHQKKFHEVCQTRGETIDNLINFEKKNANNIRSYPEDILIQKWIDGSKIFCPLDIPSTKTIMIRGARRKENGTYYYAHDGRLNFERYNCHISSESVKEIYRTINFPFLVLRFSETSYFSVEEYWRNAADVLEKTSEDFQMTSLEGSHHSHLKNAKMVADVINPFLEKHDLG